MAVPYFLIHPCFHCRCAASLIEVLPSCNQRYEHQYHGSHHLESTYEAFARNTTLREAKKNAVFVFLLSLSCAAEVAEWPVRPLLTISFQFSFNYVLTVREGNPFAIHI